MHTLVTGGNEHLGYNFVKVLLDGGHSVRAQDGTDLLDRQPAAHRAALD
jgi:nucleoside-diphosphate-sugar epimerase